MYVISKSMFAGCRGGFGRPGVISQMSAHSRRFAQKFSVESARSCRVTTPVATRCYHRLPRQNGTWARHLPRHLARNSLLPGLPDSDASIPVGRPSLGQKAPELPPGAHRTRGPSPTAHREEDVADVRQGLEGVEASSRNLTPGGGCSRCAARASESDTAAPRHFRPT